MYHYGIQDNSVRCVFSAAYVTQHTYLNAENNSD